MKITGLAVVALFAVQNAWAEGPFHNPLPYFSDTFLPVLSHFEKAKIETTLRGFYLRADTHPGMKDEHSPSEDGLYLNVAVRDPEEIPVFRDTSKVTGGITDRTVEIPAPRNEEVALRIVFIFGRGANQEAVSAISSSVEKLLKQNSMKP